MFSYSCSIISTGALVASSVLSKVLWCLLQQHYSWIKSIKTTRTSNLLVPYFKDMTVLMLKIMSWVFSYELKISANYSQGRGILYFSFKGGAGNDNYILVKVFLTLKIVLCNLFKIFLCYFFKLTNPLCL